MIKPLKIAFVYDLIYPYTTGGAEKRFRELAGILSRQGHDVHLYGMKFWEGPDEFSREGITLHGVALPDHRFSQTGVRSLGQVLRFSLCLFARIAQDDFDIVDCNEFPYLHFFGLKFLTLFKKFKLIVTWQEVWDAYWYEFAGPVAGFLGRIVERMVIAFSPVNIVHSRLVEHALRRFTGAASIVESIPNGIDLEQILASPVSEERSDIIFAGRLIAHKRVDRLLEALVPVKQRFGGIKAVIIGNGIERERLLAMAKGLGIRDQVVFKDFMDHGTMVSALKASRVFVFPSEREGFGIAPLEAMACGLPVIAVRHPLNASVELIQDGVNGLVAGDSVHDLAEKVIAVLGDERTREAMAKAAEGFARQFGWERVARLNEDLYRRTLEGKR